MSCYTAIFLNRNLVLFSVSKAHNNCVPEWNELLNVCIASIHSGMGLQYTLSGTRYGKDYYKYSTVLLVGNNYFTPFLITQLPDGLLHIQNLISTLSFTVLQDLFPWLKNDFKRARPLYFCRDRKILTKPSITSELGSPTMNLTPSGQTLLNICRN